MIELNTLIAALFLLIITLMGCQLITYLELIEMRKLTKRFKNGTSLL